MTRLLTLTMMMTFGCYSKSSYTEDVSTAFCTLYDDCDYLEVQQIDDYDACIPVVSESQDPENRDCDWDAGAAKECVEGINMMTCDDLYDSDYPLACEKTCTRGQ
jgi:hypothetical protein